MFTLDKKISLVDIFTIIGVIVGVGLGVINFIDNKTNTDTLDSHSQSILNAMIQVQSASKASASAEIKFETVKKEYTIVKEDINTIQRAMTNFYSNQVKSKGSTTICIR